MTTMSTPTGFATRLRRAVDGAGPLCVGIDPHRTTLNEWGLADTAAGVREFSLRLLDAAADRAAAVKPQSAFFERHGSAGVAVLEEVLAAARDRGLLSVLDVKRGDIGSTMGGYAEAYLGADSPLRADSVTLSPYLGYGSLAPAVDLAARQGRGVWVLGLTSNPQGPEVQLVGEPCVAATVVEHVRADNATEEARRVGFGHVGLVVGATLPRTPEDLGIDLAAAAAPVLCPGVGAQGAGPADVARLFAGLTDRVLVPVSRGITGHGPDGPGLVAAIQDLGRELQEALHG